MELYAIKYGEKFKYATYETVYKGSKNPSELVPDFVFSYYLAVYKEKVILIDTGFRNEKKASDMGITLYDVRNELEQIGKHSYDVDTIIITHSHFDHIDNLDLYHSPTIIISEPEYEFAMDTCTDEVKSSLQKGNVIKVKDEYIYDNKFTFKVIGGHSEGSSVIYFHEGEKSYLITGDECYMCNNILKNIPIGMAFNSDKNEEFINNTYNKGWIPLPFHDGSILSSYERITDNIVRVIYDT